MSYFHFQNIVAERLYRQRRGDFLCKQDAYCGVLAALIWLVWGFKVHSRLHARCLLHSLSCAACALLPCAAQNIWGTAAYCRVRTPAVIALRLALVLLAAAPTDCAATQLAPDSHDLLVMLHLVLPARTFTLLVSCLGFQLAPGLHFAVHSAVVAGAMAHTRTVCALPYFCDPHVRAALQRIAILIGKVAVFSPTPLPPLELPAHLDVCMSLIFWIQLAWLHLWPSALVAKWDLKARREFALAQPPGLVSEEERAQWQGMTNQLLYTLVLFFLPQALLALWHLLVPAVGRWGGAPAALCQGYG